jgi:hypothetical protein
VRIGDDECKRLREEEVVMSAQIGRIFPKTTLPETTSHSPAVAFFEGRLFIAWKGSGNDNLNILCSQRLSDGAMPSFDSGKKHISGETSDNAPALTVFFGRLFIAWKGSGNDNLNVAPVDFADFGGDFEIRGIVNKKILGDTSSKAPALASFDQKLFIAWKGSGNDNLNLMYSDTQGDSFRTDLKHISEETSDAAPALATHRGKLFIAWKGSGNDALNSAEVLFSPDQTQIKVFAHKQILPAGDPDHPHVASSNHGPAFLSYGERDIFGGGTQSSLFMAWRDNFQTLDEKLGIAASDSGTDFGSFPGDFDQETSDLAPALSSSTTDQFDPGDLFIAWKGAGNDNLNVGKVEVTVT